MIQIIEAYTPESLENIRLLFREYAAFMNEYSCFKHFETEIASLPGVYNKPEGRLALAVIQDQPAGCVALKKQALGIAELKRLYVRPAFRQQKAGRALTEYMIQEAVSSGYTKLRLDTLPFLKEALRLYESLNFYPIEPYRENFREGTLFFECVL